MTEIDAHIFPGASGLWHMAHPDFPELFVSGESPDEIRQAVLPVAVKMLQAYKRDALELRAERDALRQQLEAAECHAEALEDALNEPLWRFDNPIAPVALVGAALLLGWLLWRVVEWTI
ncbi:hypothetical protein ACVDG3_08765 [Meridianimarinicoccus sp. RP-17]|uniref:hypothetical protein n=1 Tax=Meridianimarinicoccus zhengii TaxID=2056810 RepID=UPI000DAF3A21|nr:hypothetical protein [Phycocomes zhengii]